MPHTHLSFFVHFPIPSPLGKVPRRGGWGPRAAAHRPQGFPLRGEAVSAADWWGAFLFQSSTSSPQKAKKTPPPRLQPFPPKLKRPLTVSVFQLRSVKGHFCSVLLSNIILFTSLSIVSATLLSFFLFSSDFSSSSYFFSHTRDSFSAELIHFLKVSFESFVLYGSGLLIPLRFSFHPESFIKILRFALLLNQFWAFWKGLFVLWLQPFALSCVHQLVFSSSCTLFRIGLAFDFSFALVYEFFALRRS